MPLFSILIPCYNGAKTLVETLDSVCAQTYRDFEVVAVNDGSTDSSLEILQSFSEELPLQIISQENAGLGAARNTGILNSTGEYVAFLDADDIWLRSKLQRVRELITTSEPDLICHYEDMQIGGRSLGILRHGPYTNYYDLLFKGNCLSPSAVCVRRELLLDVGLFSVEKEVHGCEDWDLWLKISKTGANIQYIEEVLGVYVLYDNNMSQAAGFYKKGRHVFESHVSKMSPVSADIRKQIQGARAIHEIHAAIGLFKSAAYIEAGRSLIKAFIGGPTSQFFWSQLFLKSFNVLRRKINNIL